jgi:hypothetical protein
MHSLSSRAIYLAGKSVKFVSCKVLDLSAIRISQAQLLFAGKVGVNHKKFIRVCSGKK